MYIFDANVICTLASQWFQIYLNLYRWSFDNFYREICIVFVCRIKLKSYLTRDIRYKCQEGNFSKKIHSTIRHITYPKSIRSISLTLISSSPTVFTLRFLCRGLSCKKGASRANCQRRSRWIGRRTPGWRPVDPILAV